MLPRTSLMGRLVRWCASIGVRIDVIVLKHTEHSSASEDIEVGVLAISLLKNMLYQ